jgi:hypothetical protein
MGILIETRKIAIQGQQRMSMLDYARSVQDEAVAIFDASVSPDALDDNTTTPSLVFERDRCAIVSSRDFDGKDFYLTALSNTSDTLTARKSVRMDVSVLDAARMSGKAVERQSQLGMRGGDYSSSIRFEYSTRINEVGVVPVFRDRLDPGEYPKLIRIRVKVEPFGAKSDFATSDSLELVTSVAPL